MKVLHVHQHARFFGGVEQILHDTASGLAERGSAQALLHLDGAEAPDFLGPFAAAGRDISILQSFDPDVVLVHKLADAPLARRLAELRPSIRFVHDHDVYCPRRHKYFPLTGKVCERPAGATCYAAGCFVERSPAGSIMPVSFRGFGAFQRNMTANRGMRRYVAGSRWVAGQLERNGFNAEHIDVVHPVPRAVTGLRALPRTDKPNILFVGQIVRGKGVDLMLHALAVLPGEWQATVVGDGNHLPQCQAMARELGLKDRVRFTGWVPHDQLEAHYADAMVTVVPSRWPEPFGMVGVEAMARGRPVVGFDTGGITDWLEHEVNGLLCPAADVNALAAALERILHNDTLAARLSEGATRTAGKQFSHAGYLDALTRSLEKAR
ncbi:MAG: glycosyltransferase family 4 protein [Gammaproteobacteria bacterium]|jgi:glycosyltransferase involved in cell wall biosynthesis